MVSPEANAMAPILLGGLADIAGIVAIFMLFTITAIALLNSAQDGEAFGKGAAGHIITGRMLLSGILLLPTPSGYCCPNYVDVHHIRIKCSNELHLPESS